jgi:hypothetical protein
MSTNPTPIPSSSAAPTVPTPDSLSPSLRRKYDEIVQMIVPGAIQSNKRKRPSLYVPYYSFILLLSLRSSATMSAFEKLISCCKFFMRAVHPYVTLTEVMLYGPDKHWGTALATYPSNIVSVSPAYVHSFVHLSPTLTVQLLPGKLSVKTLA